MRPAPVLVSALLAIAALAAPFGGVASAASPKPLYGANVHPWSNFQANVNYVAATPGMSIVRWDEQLPGTPVATVVADYDYVTSKHLQSDIVLVQACCNDTATFTYVRALAQAMGPTRTPIVEITNEPNAVGFGDPWPATTYWNAIYSARNGLGQSGMSNLRISMGGLAMNDQAYLRNTGIPTADYVTDFANLHLYTQGGSPQVGPLAPDDPDTAHSGYFSFISGAMQTTLHKPLIVGEWGWAGMPDYQRASYMRAAVSIAKQTSVYALIVEEIGTGDGAAADLTGTASWAAFSDAAQQ